MRKWVLGAVCAIPFALFAGCAGGEETPSETTMDGGGASSEASTTPPGADSGQPGNPDGGASEAGSDAPTCTPPDTPPTVVFLNRGGGTYTAGPNNSQNNTTALISTTTTITPWAVSNTNWQTLVDCVTTKFAPFNVAVTDVDPGDQEHFEVVFVQGTLPDLYEQPGIAPFNCTVLQNAISFVSQTYAEANLTNGCAVAVQMVAHTLGLERVTTCPDAMTFNPTACADAAFTDVALPCGSNTPTNCECGPGTTQSSYARLLAVTGPRCL